MERCRLKIVVLEKLLRALVQSMHKQGSHTGVLRDSDCASDGVLEEGPAETQPLDAAINRKLGKDHRRNGIGHVAANAIGCRLVRDRASRHRVVGTDTAILSSDDKGSARAAGLVCNGPAFEPVMQLSLAAIKIIQSVRGSQRHGWTEWQAQAFTAISPAKLGLRAGGASSSFVN